jgi:hypothetical protein
MADLTIPEKYYSAVAKIRRLSEVDVEVLSSALQQASSTTDPRQLAAQIASKVTGINDQDLREIVRTLSALCQVRASAEVTVTQFAADLREAMRDSGNKELAVPDEEAPGFERRISKLIQADALNVAAKAADLRVEYPKLFCDARILTDLRPVFGADPAARPIGFVFAHTLKLDFHVADGGHEEFYVALDSGDIAKLKDVLRRAEIKSESLRALLKEAGIRDLDSKPEA